MPYKIDYRTALEKKIKQQFKKNGLLVKQGAAQLNMSTSKLHALFKNHEDMEVRSIKVFADYLGVNTEHAKALNSHKLYESNDSLPIKEGLPLPRRKQLTDTLPQSTNSQSKEQPRKVILFAVFFIPLCIILITYYIGSEESDTQLALIQSSKYHAVATDISVPNLSLSHFNQAMYKYGLEHLVINKLNGELTFTAEIIVKSIETNEVFLTGAIDGKGYYFGDQASVSYRVIEISHGELWTGVFMFDLPSMGQATGYWLTSHNDNNTFGGYKYSIGNVALTRDSEKVIE
ncbi:MAG: hypothetical protein HRU25_10415 [Psychrobium sp.]|nr:hypothetical protein [Psychrobium sp.]